MLESGTVNFFGFITTEGLFRNEGRLDDMLNAPSHTVDSTYNPGHAIKEQGRSLRLWAWLTFDKPRAAMDVKSCRKFLQKVEKGPNTLVASGQSGFNCELLQVVLLPVCINSSF